MSEIRDGLDKLLAQITEDQAHGDILSRHTIALAAKLRQLMDLADALPK